MMKQSSKRRKKGQTLDVVGSAEGSVVCVVNTVDWVWTVCPFLFFSPHDLFDLLSINQQRMYLNGLDVYLRKPLYSCGCLYSPFTFLGSGL